MAPRIVVHASLVDFLQAIEGIAGADSVRSNHLVGYVVQRWQTGKTAPLVNASEDAKPDEDVELLVTVWEGDELRLMFSKLSWAQCKLVSPVPSSSLGDLAIPLVPDLVSHLLTLPPFSTSPELLRSLAGPEKLVDAFTSVWPHPRKPEPGMRICPASVSSPPPRADFPPGHSMTRIQDIRDISPADMEYFAQLWIAFLAGHDPQAPTTVEDATAQLLKSVPSGATWLYRAPPPSSPSSPPVPVGFVNTGRPTPRTVAIRGVCVSPTHRRLGIAERMTAYVVRAHLVDASKLSMRFRPGEERPKVEYDEATKWGGKDEVCLFVEPDNPSARKVYERVGFVEDEHVWADVDLEGIEPGYW
ncbi:hypothetical protein JCM8097_000583 [Rhodosporidiobolus ruineniae]